MNREELEILVKSGKSSHQIAREYKVCQTTIRYWLRKFGFKSQHLKIGDPNFDSFPENKASERRIINKEAYIIKYNWVDIQKSYDDGLGWREIQDKYGIASSVLSRAQNFGIFKCHRTRKEIRALETKRAGVRGVSPETRKKISESRIKYLLINPDQVPYRLNHSSRISYPEKIFEEALISFGVKGWVYAFQNGIYEYDFAFPEFKIDVEIDGGTHKLPKVQLIDKRRDEWSKSLGWTVIRFEAKEVKSDVKKCIEKLKSILDSYVNQ